MDREKPNSGESPPQDVISTQQEEQSVQDRVAIGANIVYEAIRREGEDELKRPNSALAWSGLAAGLSMGISFIVEGLLKAYLPQQHWTPLVSRLGYSVGFLMVVLGRQQLFTENTLTVVLPVMSRRTAQVFAQVLRLWSVVLVTNLLGTCLFAACVARIHLFDPDTVQALTDIGVSHTGAAFSTVFIRAIFAGWLIAMMVWLLPGAESARVYIIIILTYVIGLGQFNHIIAGSTTLFYLVWRGALSWGAYFWTFFVPTLLGNIVGGVALVAALGHGQVVGGKDLEQRPSSGKSAKKDQGRKTRVYAFNPKRPSGQV